MMFLTFDTDPVCVSKHGFPHRICLAVTDSPRTGKFHVAAFVGVLAPGVMPPAADCWADDWITAGAALAAQMHERVRDHLARHPEAGRYVPSPLEGRGLR